MSQRSFCVVLAILFSATCADRLQATDYTITAIPTGNIVPSGAPSINNAGTIAFAGSKPDGTTGIYTYSGGAVSTVVDNSGPLSTFLALPVINNSGLVAFKATSKTGFTGAYAASSGGPLLTIAAGSNVLIDGGPTLNDSGTVVFAGFANGTAGVFSGAGADLTTVVAAAGIEGYKSFGGRVSVNSSGVVAFTASTNTGNVIATHAPGQTGSTTVADTLGLSTSFDYPAINDSGTVAFTRSTTSGGSTINGIYTQTPGGTVTPFVEAGPGAAFGSAMGETLNNNGTIVFLGAANSSTGTVFDGPAPSDVVLGNSVSGSPISSLSWGGGRPLNDNGQVVFGYQLSDGTHGIALATPTPEPGGLVVAGLSAVLLIRRRTR